MKINPFARRQGVDFDIAIIGAGFSGLGMAIRLKQAGIDSFTIYERADEVGGTWRDNHYPGAACDVASHLYSFSFDQNADWSRAYGEQPEIFGYIRDCTERYGLREHIRFNSEVTRAAFDDETGLWTGHTSDGHRFTARAVSRPVTMFERHCRTSRSLWLERPWCGRVFNKIRRLRRLRRLMKRAMCRRIIRASRRYSDRTIHGLA